jgi:WD40 repeat protein
VISLADATERRTPYRGLTQFTERDAQVFFGREEETRIIASNLLASRLTLLYGPTGVGKSSLLAAGVKHHLDRRARATAAASGIPEWITVVFPSDRIAIGPRRDSWREDPVDALACAIEDAVAALDAEVTPPPRAPDLVTLLNAWTELLGAELLLILDQFEEYFLYHGSEDGEGTLAADLPRVLAKPGMGVNVLVSIREDAYAQLDHFKGRIPNLYDNYLRLDNLTPERARLAITGPIDEYNRRSGGAAVEIEPALVDAVLEQVQSGAVLLGQTGRGTVESEERRGIETPFLQLVMERLWLREQELGSRALRAETLEQLGGARSIVREHLDVALASFDPAERDIAARVFGRLVTPSGTKIASLASDLAASEDLPPEPVDDVLVELADLRVLRTIAPVMGETKPRYEIFHDVLAPAVLDWRARWAQDAQRRKLEDDLAAQEAQASHERTSARRFRMVAAVAAVLAVLALIAAVVAVDRTRNAKRDADAADTAAAEAKDAERDAVKSKNLADAASNLTADPVKAGLVAAEALPGGKGPASALATLRRALQLPAQIALINPAGGAMARGAAFSPDGDYAATIAGRQIEIWGGHEGTRFAGTSLPQAPRTVAFAPDDRAVLAATDGGVVVWRWIAGGTPTELPTRGRTLAAGFADDGRRVVAVTAHRAYVWKAGRRVSSAALHARGATVAAITREGDRAVVGTRDGARLIDLRTGRVRTLRWGVRHAGAARAIAFSRDGRRLLIGSEPAGNTSASRAAVVGSSPGRAGAASRIGLWDARSGRRLHVIRAGHAAVTTVTFAPDGASIAYGSADGVGRIRNSYYGGAFSTGPRLSGHTGQITTVAYSRDGALIVTGSGDGDARVWTAGGKLVATLAGAGDWVESATFSRDGRRLIVADAGGVRLWQSPVDRPDVRRPHASSPDEAGTRAFDIDIFGGDKRVVDIYSGQTLTTLRHSGAYFGRFADGDSRVVAMGDRTLTLWDSRTGHRIARTTSPEGFAITGPGPYALPLTDEVRRWDLQDGRLERPLGRMSGSRWARAISDDGRFVAAWGQGRIVVWDAQTRKRIGVLRHQPQSSLTFTPDASTLALVPYAGSSRRPARLWRIGARRAFPLVTRTAVRFLSMSPAGSLAATVGAENAVRIWSTTTHRRVTSLQGHRGQILDASFSRDGKRIVTASQDDTVRVWDTASGRMIQQFWVRADPYSVRFGRDARTILVEGPLELDSYTCALCGSVGDLRRMAQLRAPAR